ncbi:SUF system Fe-S cluster assembly regulator [Acidothermaceae bacterium B102]|nr:SUF system Fe-S cluster assembly regulator [Acidothermaceae bacterium B102]
MVVSATTSSGGGLRAVLRVSARADYALRLVVAMAAQPDAVLPREALAQTEQLPVTFLDHVLRQLRDGGLIESRRGRHGGYRLSRDAALISVADVVHVMEQAPAPSEEPPGAPAEWLTAVWTGLSDTVHAALSEVSIASLRDARLAEAQGA